MSSGKDTNLEKLATLKPVLGTDWVTAGISSPVTDGASAVVLMSGDKAKELNLTPLARIVANAVVGSDPVLMLTGPLVATPKVLKKAGMKVADIDIFEVNEAFAPIPLAWVKDLDAPMEKLNVNGGAMALGHPVGNSGCRLTVTAINEDLDGAPETVNSDPHGAGWYCKLKLSDAAEVDALMDAEAYTQFAESAG